MSDVFVDTRQLDRYINSLNSAPRVAVRSASKWIKRLTKYTEGKMKRFARARTSRATGNLSSKIRSEYKLGSTHLSGIVFVPEEVKYQFAANYGFKRRFTIYGKPLMAFDESAWKKARRASSIIRLGKKGVYIFARVKRGRYKGRHFVEKAFDALLTYYGSKETAIVSDIGESLAFGKG